MATIELNHEQRYVKESAIRKERRDKAAEKVKNTEKNRLTRLEEEDKRHKESKDQIGVSFKGFAEEAEADLAKEELLIKEMDQEHQATIARVKAAKSTTEEAATGMVSCLVPVGIPLISPAQCNIDHVQAALHTAALPNGFLAGSSPQFLQGIALLMKQLMEHTAVLPPQGPGNGVPAPLTPPALPKALGVPPKAPPKAPGAPPATTPGTGSDGLQDRTGTAVTAGEVGKNKRTDESNEGEDGSGEAFHKQQEGDTEDPNL